MATYSKLKLFSVVLVLCMLALGPRATALRKPSTDDDDASQECVESHKAILSCLDDSRLRGKNISDVLPSVQCCDNLWHQKAVSFYGIRHRRNVCKCIKEAVDYQTYIVVDIQFLAAICNVTFPFKIGPSVSIDYCSK
ncbi:hypothetical protein CCACVL1_21186 [Corchorus capsularis]|uniref:Bifunctional inhibitor/plant lipid transfer protein/seed storage helical domain-containing protein n=1 Tax=Corchorus capsularis TaxID=210143 RepID=A0A1R3H7P5_COCAP|nr:hypothetical protein CCACVL1_21186 [Corchorus capsularis]